jgi:hypothetical protein
VVLNEAGEGRFTGPLALRQPSFGRWFRAVCIGKEPFRSFCITCALINFYRSPSEE